MGVLGHPVLEDLHLPRPKGSSFLGLLLQAGLEELDVVPEVSGGASQELFSLSLQQRDVDPAPAPGRQQLDQLVQVVPLLGGQLADPPADQVEGLTLGRVHLFQELHQLGIVDPDPVHQKIGLVDLDLRELGLAVEQEVGILTATGPGQEEKRDGNGDG